MNALFGCFVITCFFIMATNGGRCDKFWNGNLCVYRSELQYALAREQCPHGYHLLEIYNDSYSVTVATKLYGEVEGQVYISRISGGEWKSGYTYHSEFFYLPERQGPNDCVVCSLTSQAMDCKEKGCIDFLKTICEADFTYDDDRVYSFKQALKEASDITNRCPDQFSLVRIYNNDQANHAKKVLLSTFNLHPHYMVLIGGFSDDMRLTGDNNQAPGFNPEKKRWVYFDKEYKVPSLCEIDYVYSTDKKFAINPFNKNWFWGQTRCPRGYRLAELPSLTYVTNAIATLTKNFKSEESNQRFFVGARSTGGTFKWEFTKTTINDNLFVQPRYLCAAVHVLRNGKTDKLKLTRESCMTEYPSLCEEKPKSESG